MYNSISIIVNLGLFLLEKIKFTKQFYNILFNTSPSSPLAHTHVHV